MFSAELGLTLEAAFREAATRRNVFFCLEHLLYALSFDTQVLEVLKRSGVEIKILRKDLETFFDSGTRKKFLLKLMKHFIVNLFRLLRCSGSFNARSCTCAPHKKI